MTSSAAAGWQWAVGWLPWQHASNRVAKANGPGMRMKAFSLAARPPPTTPQHLPHPNPLARFFLPPSFSQRGSVQQAGGKSDGNAP